MQSKRDLLLVICTLLLECAMGCVIMDSMGALRIVIILTVLLLVGMILFNWRKITNAIDNGLEKICELENEVKARDKKRRENRPVK